MFRTNKTFDSLIVIAILLALLVSALLFSRGIKYTVVSLNTDSFSGGTNAHGLRSNDTIIMIGDVPDKIEGDFILPLTVNDSIDKDVSYIVFHSTDGNEWKPLPGNTYRAIDKNNILIHGSLLEEGEAYFGVSLNDTVSPDEMMNDPAEVISSKGPDGAGGDEGFAPGTVTCVIIGVGIIIIGGFALIYKGRTDQIRSITRQLVREEGKKEREEKAKAEYGRPGDYVSHHSDRRRDDFPFEGTGRGDSREDTDGSGDISWGEIDADDGIGWDDEGSEDETTWKRKEEGKGGRSRGRGRYEEKEYKDERVSGNGYGPRRSRSGRGRGSREETERAQERRRSPRRSRQKGKGGRGREARREGSGRKDRGGHRAHATRSHERRGTRGRRREERERGEQFPTGRTRERSGRGRGRERRTFTRNRNWESIKGY